MACSSSRSCRSSEQRVTGIEALLRWQHPELGEVLPEEFLPLAERAGLVGELQRWMLEAATAAAAALPERRGPAALGVNVPPGYLAHRHAGRRRRSRRCAGRVWRPSGWSCRSRGRRLSGDERTGLTSPRCG